MALERTEIAARLRQEIARGKYRPGEKLPSQRELATQLGAAPNTVGEAIKLLASDGLVRIRDRSGAEVLDPNVDAAPVADPTAEAREVLQQVQSELREARSQLTALDRRITESLERLDRSG
jgi:DNA-binding GntR family transcriptional regulator